MQEQIKNRYPVPEGKPKTHSNTLAIVVVASVLLVAGIGYYLLEQLRDKQEGLGGRLHQENQQIIEMNKQLGTFQSQLATLQSQLATLEGMLATRDSRFERALTEQGQRHDEKLKTAENALNEAVLRLQRQLGKTRGDWLIADAEYLLSVANERLQLGGDIKTTFIALEAADQRLRESGDPAVFKVREAIAGEISTLKNINPPDIVGTFSRLQALSMRMAELPLFLPHAGKTRYPPQKPASQDKTEVESFDDLVDSAWQDLKGLIVIRRTEHPVEAVLLPEQADMIRQNLQSEMEIAKIALVRRDPELFRSGLENVRNWLVENYQANAEMNAVLAELKGLQDAADTAKMPDIGGSLKLLRDITKLRIETDKALQDKGKTDAAAGKP